MEFLYSVSYGEMFLLGGQSDKLLLGKGYSGYREYRNNAAYETRKALGPIPRGQWLLRQAQAHPRLGPVCIGLEPQDVPNLAGRSEFFIHGDNVRGDFSASTGCIILARGAREAIAGLYRPGVRTLTVF